MSSSLSRRGFLGLGAAAVGAVTLGACGDSGSGTAAPRASSAASLEALEPYTVRTCVYAKNHASAALYWERFAPEGITVQVTPVASATEIQNALEAGQLDFGLLAPYTPILSLQPGQTPITSKIVGMISRGGLGLCGKKGVVDTVQDLRGKKIAVPPPTLQVLILNQVLKDAGLELGKDVEAVPLGFADHFTAFATGDVDAFMGSEPPVTQAIVEAGGVRLPEASMTPVGDFNTANWASAKVLEERPDVVRAVCQMQKDAAEYLSPGGENDPAVWEDLLVDPVRLREQTYETVLGNIGARWEFDDERVGQIEGAARMLVDQGAIAAAPDVEQLFARDYWEAEPVAAGLVEDLAVASGAPAARRRSPRRRGRRLLGLAVPLLLLGAWQLAASAELVTPRLLPSPADVAEQIRLFFFGEPGTLTLAGRRALHRRRHRPRAVQPAPRAAPAGRWPSPSARWSAWRSGCRSLARDLLDPVLNALRAVPIFAWLPLALVWFGIGEGAARALIFIGALWPVLVAVGDATARVPRGHVETARMLGTPQRWLWRRVYLPSALPEVVTGLRLSLTLAWTCVIVGELSGTTSGVGAMMNARARERPHRPGRRGHPGVRGGRPARRPRAADADAPLGPVGRRVSRGR